MFELNNLIELIYNLEYWICLLFGFPLNILVIILIIYKTPKEMKTHSRILIQNCIIDILQLTFQMILQTFYISDSNGKIFIIFTNGILIKIVKENFNPFILYILYIIWVFISILNLLGLSVQFVYRYLILNRNIKITLRRYFCMFSVALLVDTICTLQLVFFLSPYSDGGIKQFNEGHFNKTWPFFESNYKHNELSFIINIPLVIIQIIPFFIIFVCAYKMIRYVYLNSNFDSELKIMVKQLTKTLIILAITPLISKAGTIFVVFFVYLGNEPINLIRFFIYICYHLNPLFNPIICILTNKPYRNAVFNRLRINPQQ
ncbi:hypothetical protein ACQ4LE_000955 [Meloidogyne hapla]